MVALAFPEHPPTVSDCTNHSAFPRTVVFDFPPPPGSTWKNTRVIAYKGTDTLLDANVDLILWSTIKVFQMLSTFIPVINMMHTDQVQWMIERAHIPGQMHVERTFWRESIDN